MRSKNQKLQFKIWTLLLSVFYLLTFCALPVFATQDKLTLTITPPLFQLNIGPRESWSSSLKVVNANNYDLTLYASVMNFEASGEGGQGKFTPVIKSDPETSANTLANWIAVSKKPVFVPKEKSAEIPFTVRIPENAPPGGHYAAILIGTKPLDDKNTEGPMIHVSSMVSSLLFVNIKGEVQENGYIREFSTEKTFYQKPEMAFTLRFENTGNVHLQPQGDIVIYNMWGKKRGEIPINQKTYFGNVLPGSVRKFVFEWQGEDSPFEVGRYQAIATLSFGQEARQNVFRAIYFWVVPLKPTLIILGSFLVFIIFIAWAIRAYIKRVLKLEKDGIEPIPQKSQFQKSNSGVLTLPFTKGVIDLRNIAKQNIVKKALNKNAKPMLNFLRLFCVPFRIGLALSKKYYEFFIFVALFVLGLIAATIFFQQFFMRERVFEIIIPKENQKIIKISNEISDYINKNQ